MRFGWQTRLARSKEIDRVFRFGKRQNCGAFLLVAYRRGAEESPEASARVCVVASRRISKRAVIRNRLKRRMRSLFRLNVDRIPSGVDLVLIARQSMVKTAFADLDARFKKACAQLEQL